jgi:hypothetical protein
MKCHNNWSNLKLPVKPVNLCVSNRVRPIPVSGDSCQYRLVPASGDTFLSIAAVTGLASVGHGAISRRYR